MYRYNNSILSKNNHSPSLTPIFPNLRIKNPIISPNIRLATTLIILIIMPMTVRTASKVVINSKDWMKTHLVFATIAD
jgi:hypothetical protein